MEKLYKLSYNENENTLVILNEEQKELYNININDIYLNKKEMIDDQIKINRLDCLKDGAASDKSHKNTKYSKAMPNHKMMLQLKLFSYPTAGPGWHKALESYEKTLLENNKQSLHSRSWIGKKSLDIDLKVSDYDYSLWESGASSNLYCTKKNKQEIEVKSTFGSFIDPLEKDGIKGSSYTKWPDNNVKIIIDKKAMELFGFDQSYLESIYTDKWDFELEIAINTTDCKINQCKILPNHKDKYCIGNNKKKEILIDLENDNSPNSNKEKIKYIVMKEWGDKMQVLIYFIMFNVPGNDEYKNVVMVTTDTVVFTLCVTLKIPCIYNGICNNFPENVETYTAGENSYRYIHYSPDSPKRQLINMINKDLNLITEENNNFIEKLRKLQGDKTFIVSGSTRVFKEDDKSKNNIVVLFNDIIEYIRNKNINLNTNLSKLKESIDMYILNNDSFSSEEQELYDYYKQELIQYKLNAIVDTIFRIVPKQKYLVLFSSHKLRELKNFLTNLIRLSTNQMSGGNNDREKYVYKVNLETNDEISFNSDQVPVDFNLLLLPKETTKESSSVEIKSIKNDNIYHSYHTWFNETTKTIYNYNNIVKNYSYIENNSEQETNFLIVIAKNIENIIKKYKSLINNNIFNQIDNKKIEDDEIFDYILNLYIKDSIIYSDNIMPDIYNYGNDNSNANINFIIYIAILIIQNTNKLDEYYYYFKDKLYRANLIKSPEQARLSFNQLLLEIEQTFQIYNKKNKRQQSLAKETQPTRNTITFKNQSKLQTVYGGKKILKSLLNYKNKYMKYKLKYQKLINQKGGMKSSEKLLELINNAETKVSDMLKIIETKEFQPEEQLVKPKLIRNTTDEYTETYERMKADEVFKNKDLANKIGTDRIKLVLQLYEDIKSLCEKKNLKYTIEEVLSINNGEDPWKDSDDEDEEFSDEEKAPTGILNYLFGDGLDDVVYDLIQKSRKATELEEDEKKLLENLLDISTDHFQGLMFILKNIYEFNQPCTREYEANIGTYGDPYIRQMNIEDYRKGYVYYALADEPICVVCKIRESIEELIDKISSNDNKSVDYIISDIIDVFESLDDGNYDDYDYIYDYIYDGENLNLPRGNTPLHLAVKNNNIDAVKLLIKLGDETNDEYLFTRINEEGHTPLDIAIREGFNEIKSILLS